VLQVGPLGDPARADRPILLIAFDCGFASVGPFNRAFKAETGLTPRMFRRRAEVKAAQEAA
jgi:AraC-like DNA-binding protein